MVNNLELSYFLKTAKLIAMIANGIIRKAFSESLEITWKKDDSPVTATDIAVNEMVIDRIKCFYPDHGLLGEELSDRTGKEEFLWVCDPIDGTSAFVCGFPEFVFSLALLHEREVVLGIVCDPMMNRIYTATSADTAFLGNQEIHVSDNTTLEHSFIGTCYWKDAPYDFSNLDMRLRDNGAKTISARSVIYSSMMVASGKLSGVFFPGNAPHDAATVKIIVEKAGGKVTDVYGKDQFCDEPIKGFVASNGRIHDQMLELISDRV